MAAMRGVQERPAGLTYRPDVLSPAEEEALLARFESLDFEPVVMHGQEARRTVRHFGFGYAFDSGELAPTDPIPEYLLDVRARCAEMAAADAAAFEQALVSRYPAGATIGWQHSIPPLGETRHSITFRTVR